MARIFNDSGESKVRGQGQRLTSTPVTTEPHGHGQKAHGGFDAGITQIEPVQEYVYNVPIERTRTDYVTGKQETYTWKTVQLTYKPEFLEKSIGTRGAGDYIGKKIPVELIDNFKASVGGEWIGHSGSMYHAYTGGYLKLNSESGRLSFSSTAPQSVADKMWRIAAGGESGRMPIGKKIGYLTAEQIRKERAGTYEPSPYDSAPSTIAPTASELSRNNIELGGGYFVPISVWNKIPQRYQTIGMRQGYEAMSNAIKADTAKTFPQYEAPETGRWYDQAAKQYYTDSQRTKLIADYETRRSSLIKQGKMFTNEWNELIKNNPSNNTRLTAEAGKPAVMMAAELVVPGLYEVRHWNEMSVGEKAVLIGLDVMSLVPIAFAATKGARAVGTAGKLARLQAAGKAAGIEAIAIARAPVDMIIHPVGTVKGTIKETRNLLETLLHPKKLPEAIITTSNGTVRLKLSQATSKEEALAIRAKIMELASQTGENVVVQVGKTKVELARSPLMRELGGGLAHGTPMGEAFTKGLKVMWKSGKPLSEQGLFLSHEPLPRFIEQSAFGLKGERSAIIITSAETAQKAIDTEKIYKGFVEMERKFPLGTKLTPPKQILFTRIGVNSVKTEIFLEKPLTIKQIAKLKAEGLIEWIKAPFKEPIMVSKGKLLKANGLTAEQVDKLAKILKEAGAIDQAENLIRVERVARAVRQVPPTLARTAGIVSTRELMPQGTRIPTSTRITPTSRIPSVTTLSTTAPIRDVTGISEAESRITREARATDESRISRIVRDERLQSEKVSRIIRNDERQIERAKRMLNRVNDRIERAERQERERTGSGARQTRERIDRLHRQRREIKKDIGELKSKIKAKLEKQESKVRTKIPIGSITWRQGIFWKYIPYPWTINKPITLKQPPDGAKTDGRTPAETIQIIGKPDAKVPHSIMVDLGFADIQVIDGKAIRFSPFGTRTDVGSRMPSTTRGLSISGKPHIPKSLLATRTRRVSQKATRAKRRSVPSLSTVRL